MKAKRRPMYINAAKSVLGDDVPIECWYSLPTLEEYAIYDKLDFEQWSKTHTPGPFDGPVSMGQLSYRLNEFEWNDFR